MTDKEIILNLGGPTEVAKLLKYDLKKGGAQRVQNWMTRGIPSKVKVDHPDLFMNPVPSNCNVVGTGESTRADCFDGVHPSLHPHGRLEVDVDQQNAPQQQAQL